MKDRNLGHLFKTLDYLKAEYVRKKKKEGRQKGGHSEKLVDMTLDELIGDAIITWWNSTYDEDHYEGKDRMIMKLSGDVKSLQIKSSEKGRQYAFDHHPGIPCIVVAREDTLNDIKSKLKSLL